MDNELSVFTNNLQEISKTENKISKAIATFQKELDERRKKDSELREQIKQAMNKSGIKKLENQYISITYVAPTTRETIDTKQLKEDMPELWESYKKVSDVKDSLRINVKGE